MMQLFETLHQPNTIKQNWHNKTVIWLFLSIVWDLKIASNQLTVVS